MKKYVFSFLSLLLVSGMSSCIKEHYTGPPAGGTDPNLTPNTTIAALKAMLPSGGGANFNLLITQNLMIEAVVVADDQSGNLYKSVAIEDSTGGINLLLDGTYLYTKYPVGRRLFINVTNLLICRYNGLYELAGYIQPGGKLGGIPSPLFSQYITAGKWGQYMAPKVINVAQLSDAYQFELVQFNNVQFISGDMAQPYADSYGLKSVSRTLENCFNGIDGQTMVAYTSGYANFANVLTPSGNGTLLAVFDGYYNGTPQLLVRDTSEVNLYGPRLCP